MMRLVSGGIGNCLVEMKVDEEHLNKADTLHGGCIATLVDIVSSLALASTFSEPGPQSFGVSVDLSVSYLKAAQMGDVIQIDAKSIKVGKNLAFLEAAIRNKKNGELIATGKHTKFIGQGKPRL